MNCPACKMETPEELGYCDFCKEPFRKKAPPPEPKPQSETVAVPPEVMAKVMAAARAPEKAAPVETAGGIPPEFAELDRGEKIPEIPPVARQLAYAFLAVIVLWTLVGIGYVLTRHKRPKLPSPPPIPGHGGMPLPPPPPPPPPSF